MNDGPFRTALDQLPSQGVYQHSLVTYKYVNDQLIKVTNTRTYSADGDYIDTHASEPIGKGSSV